MAPRSSRVWIAIEGESVNEIVVVVIWLLIGVVGLGLVQRRIPASDRRLVWLCFWAHIASAYILIWLVYNILGGGDIEVYYYYGDGLADYIRRDPGKWGPEVVRLILQIDAYIPMELYGSQGSSTSSLIGITSILMVITGSSELGTGLFFSMVAFSGQMTMYFAFRNHFPAEYRQRLLIALLLVPSAVFWTSGVVKEAVAVGGIGWMIWGLHLWIADRKRFRGAPWIIVGAVVVSITKGYILFPMSVAAAVWWFWDHSMAKTGTVAIASKPMHLVGMSVMAVVLVMGLGEVFPQYSIASLGEETAQLQETGARVEGGSNIAMGNAESTSLSGQLVFAPMALLASLFRPFIFEAHNLMALINGLEMTVVLVLWIRILRVRGARESWRLLRTSPVLVFCAVFTVLAGLGIGLGTTNLGTLSRYRVPLMPMYILVLMMLWPSSKTGGRQVTRDRNSTSRPQGPADEAQRNSRDESGRRRRIRSRRRRNRRGS